MKQNTSRTRNPLLLLSILLSSIFAITFALRVQALVAPGSKLPTRRVSSLLRVSSLHHFAFKNHHHLRLFSTVKMTTTQCFATLQEETDASGLFESWLHHSSSDFHAWNDPTEVEAIRSALLTWYRQHRRALPWRGDPPPWNGSTVDFGGVKSSKKAKSNNNGNNNKKKQQQQQLTDFFQQQTAPDACSTSAINSGSTDNDNVDENDDASSNLKKQEQQETFSAFPVTAYGVWVSEIMLQQTRVEAVVPYWIKWMKAFPTVSALAAATEEQVNARWAGLGFYRRARLLHQAAKVVHEQHNGKLPETVEGFLKLPGIGRYTASAVASIAYNVTVPVVDGNVCRVLSRLRGIAQHVKAPVLKDHYAWDLAAEIVQAGNGEHPGEVNQALMELGATYCSPSGTGVEEGDPLKDFYWSTRIGREGALLYKRYGSDCLLDMIQQTETTKHEEANGKGKKVANGSSKLTKSRKTSYCQVCGPDGVNIALESLVETLGETDEVLDDVFTGRLGHGIFPVAPPKTAKREEVLALAALSCQTGTKEEFWLLVRRPKSGLLAGQWEFPSVCVWNSDKLDSSKKGGKRKDMSNEVPIISKTVRRKALNVLLTELSSDEHGNITNDIQFANITRKQSGEQPIEHIFSHVRHTMWVETGDCDRETLELKEWVDSKGRALRWMKKSDMVKVGITSGVKKVLKIVDRDAQDKAKKGFKRAKKT